MLTIKKPRPDYRAPLLMASIFLVSFGGSLSVLHAVDPKNKEVRQASDITLSDSPENTTPEVATSPGAAAPETAQLVDTRPPQTVQPSSNSSPTTQPASAPAPQKDKLQSAASSDQPSPSSDANSQSSPKQEETTVGGLLEKILPLKLLKLKD